MPLLIVNTLRRRHTRRRRRHAHAATSPCCRRQNMTPTRATPLLLLSRRQHAINIITLLRHWSLRSRHAPHARVRASFIYVINLRLVIFAGYITRAYHECPSLLPPPCLHHATLCHRHAHYRHYCRRHGRRHHTASPRHWSPRARAEEETMPRSRVIHTARANTPTFYAFHCLCHHCRFTTRHAASLRHTDVCRLHFVWSSSNFVTPPHRSYDNIPSSSCHHTCSFSPMPISRLQLSLPLLACRVNTVFAYAVITPRSIIHRAFAIIQYCCSLH